MIATHDKNEGLGKHRIEALSDGIFGIAMTLLIIDVKVPNDISALSMPDGLSKMLLSYWPKFLSFFISFMILGLFWIAHHGYLHFMKRADRNFLWLNLLFLMVVIFVPFSADLLGHLPGHPVATMIYGGNVAMLGVTLYWQWSYATHRHRLVGKNLEPELIREGKRRICLGFLVNGGTMLLALVNPALSLVLYILFPIIYFFPGKLDHHWTHSHD